MDNQRNDLSNTILGFMATLENQAKDVPPSVQNAIRARIDRVENAEAF
jgi:hypothetical protein